MLVNEEQPRKAEYSIFVTVEGISMLWSDEHSKNADDPINVTVVGISISTSVEQLENDDDSIVVIVFGSIIFIILGICWKSCLMPFSRIDVNSVFIITFFGHSQFKNEFSFNEVRYGSIVISLNFEQSEKA